MKGLKGKVCMITGAGRGIGQGLALAMAAEGVHLVLNDLDPGPLQLTVDQAKENGAQAVAVAGSVTDTSVADQMVQQAVDQFGDLNLVVTCAGYTWDGMFHRMTDEQWQAILDVHLTGTFRILRRSFSEMRERAKNEQQQGLRPNPRKVITISSMSSFGNLGQANYASAKAGIVGLTRTIAIEGASFNILANSVAFGPIDTRLTRARESQDEHVGDVALGIPSSAREGYLDRIPLGRVGTVEDAVGPLLFFASDLSNYVSGALLEVNGAAHIS